MDILFKRANPTMLDEDDPRIRDRRDRERKGNQTLSLGDVLFTGQNRNPIHNDIASSQTEPSQYKAIQGVNEMLKFDPNNNPSLWDMITKNSGTLGRDILKGNPLLGPILQGGLKSGGWVAETVADSSYFPDSIKSVSDLSTKAEKELSNVLDPRREASLQRKRSVGGAIAEEDNAYPEVEGGAYPPRNVMDDNSPLREDNSTLRKATPENPSNKIGETPKDTPSLWKTWGSLADDPKKRRDAYLGSIKNIYMKKMMLDSIANLTGGQSQGGSWAEMAIAELDAVEKFDSEQRLHNQWKALFFREDGTYDPPKNRKEAMERGGELGYDADQMKDIMTVFPKEQVSNLELTKRYIDSLPEGSAERIALEKKHLGMYEDEKDDRTSYEKFIERIVNSGLLSKEEGDEALMRKAKGTDSGLTAAQDNFNWYQGILAEGDEEKIAVANKFLNIKGAKAATIGQFLSLYESQTFQDSDTFSPKEKAMLEELLKKAMGLGVSTVTTDSPSGITIKKKS